MQNHYSKFVTAISVVLVLLIIRFPIGGQQAQDAVYDYRQNGNQAPTELTQESTDLLTRFNNAFVDLSNASKPKVVMVSTERTVRARSGGGLFDFFGNDPLFRNHPFFRDRNRGGQEQEYQQRGLGSGVIVSEDGYILTNNHVIAGADTIIITMIDQKQVPATVVGADPRTDVAVLKVDARNLPYIKFGDSDDLQVGEMVMAIGSPLGAALAHSVTQGIVSAKGRADLGILGVDDAFENFIQTDAAINQGNSGGPLINMRGELIGINTAIMSQSGGGFQGIGFAVPSNMARYVMESIIENGRVVRGYVGIGFQSVDDNLARALDLSETRGYLVNEVVEDSPAEKAGIQSGDVILKVNGRIIMSQAEFRRRLAEQLPGTDITFTINREGKEMDVKVTLDEWPSDEIAAADSESRQDILGFSVTELTREIAERLRLNSNIRGVVVDAVDNGSSAAQNGLRQGDVITSINRQAVTSMSDFNEVIRSIDPGQVTLLQIVRANRRFFIAIELKSS